jgi:osmotically inducible protein OsmC
MTDRFNRTPAGPPDHGLTASRIRGKKRGMGEITRQGSAEWTGDLKSGQGKISSTGGFLRDLPYSVPSRFESAKGTNPEELIAAAHASCFSMMLAKLLGDQGAKADRISTHATLTLRMDASGAKITKIHLTTEVSGKDMAESTVQKAAAQAKDQCPVSQLLKPGLEQLSFEAKVAN